MLATHIVAHGSFTARLIRPRDLRDRCERTRPADPCLHLAGTCFSSSRIDLQLDPEHQLLPLLGGLDALRRELRLGRDEGDLRGEHVVGQRDRG